MIRKLNFACLLAALCAPAALAQMNDVARAPVAFVYVSSNPSNSSTNEISAYAASANGRLTPVTGSPFADDVTGMAVNGKYLFGSTRNGIYVAAFRIESDGGLRWSRSTDILQFNPSDCGSSGPLFLDRTGTTVYDTESFSDCSNNTYQSLGVDKSTGHLHNLGSSGSDEWLYLPASFIGNNVYAYSAVCLGDMYWEINGYKRSSTGALDSINISASIPTPKSGDFWCPSQTAADLANHVAITLQPVAQQDFTPDGPARLAAYSADGAGNLHTTNTIHNMPQTAVGDVTEIRMAPRGALLAVAGTSGLQVFHFNGSHPITPDTGLLTKQPIDHAFWDNAHHLYAISQSAGKLYVFTVTPTSTTQAPGSPYPISHPQNLAVQPRTPAL